MRKIICLLITMICFGSMYVDAMMNKLAIRRCRSYRYERPKIQKKESVVSSAQGTFHHSFFKEIDLNVFRFIGTNTHGKTLQESAQIFSALTCVNKYSYMHMDDDKRTLGWIKDLAKRFDCTDLDAARALRTRTGKCRVVMQLGLWLNCYPGDSYLTERIKELQTCGLDVNFSYDKEYPSPLLQCCSDLRNKLGAAHWLINNGADINICTPTGDNACMLALSKGSFVWLNKLVEHKDFKPNHQNLYGETVLHYYLYRLMGSVDDVPGLVGASISVIDACDIITKILTKGANPMLANDHGVTPLKIALAIRDKEDLRNQIVALLEQAAIAFELKKN